MNLWFSSHFLVVGLVLRISALTPEECQPLVTPLSLADAHMLYGRTNFIMGYTSTEQYDNILKATDSYWMKITPSLSSTNEVLMYQYNKMNGTCFSLTVNVTFDGDVATTSLKNITTTFHVLPSCEGCLVLSGNSTARNLKKFFQSLNIDSSFNEEEVTTRVLYLMGKESTLKDSDLEHFKRQASCLGFPREPDFHHDPKKDFCSEDESLQISLQ
ncbi:uncharacterized protein LOC127358085 isoform X3 [Dicentrarchus labrax]|uniref:uncharacterized protein LOC127358085 isoform X3 n=1 Tax=Dicentrarchus labrax TaxID=13489 RepID=UPI0021F5990A|nr:uncharacterized protein LOC127358085 isoform X3 [Dicentrarchus labrax]